MRNGLPVFGLAFCMHLFYAASASEECKCQVCVSTWHVPMCQSVLSRLPHCKEDCVQSGTSVDVGVQKPQLDALCALCLDSEWPQCMEIRESCGTSKPQRSNSEQTEPDPVNTKPKECFLTPDVVVSVTFCCLLVAFLVFGPFYRLETQETKEWKAAKSRVEEWLKTCSPAEVQDSNRMTACLADIDNARQLMGNRKDDESASSAERELSLQLWAVILMVEYWSKLAFSENPASLREEEKNAISWCQEDAKKNFKYLFFRSSFSCYFSLFFDANLI